jgi:acetyl esterase/lipase
MIGYLDEQRMRRLLPVLRIMLGYVPMKVMRWLQAWGEMPLPDDVRHESVKADGVRCEWLLPEGCVSDKVLLYLHGGGFVYGWTDSHRHMVAHLARQMGVRALAVDYRLAPEHPFPAALEDCVAAYRWLLKQGIAPESIVVAGDSAGGNLTLTTMLWLRDHGDPLPAAAACLSPATDMTEREEIRRGFDPILHPRALIGFRASYVANNDPSDPLLSPVYADLHGLPPLLIHAGEDEILCGDCVRMAEVARQAGVETRVEVYPRMWHVWHMNFAELPEGAAALEDIAQFLSTHLGVREQVRETAAISD